MKQDSYITKYTCAFLLLVAGLPCLQARNECYRTGTHVYYCDDGYECCNGNTKCCPTTTSSSSASTPLIVGAVVGGVFGFVVVFAVVRIICNHANKNKTVIQPRGQVVVTVDQQQQLQQQPAYYTAYPSGSYPSATMTDPPMYPPAPNHVAAPANPPEYSK